MTNNEYLKAKRAERVAALIGKYVVIADNSKDPTSVLYFQDPSLVKPTEAKTSQWTRFLPNALGFETAEEARAVASGFRYGHPRVGQI